ncbi:hypothetical protein SPLC1_S130640 [Arthrospira platensis C1]|nr:hypothetical protein SPLC1_S130640 [Arthrospira platensis C1]
MSIVNYDVGADYPGNIKGVMFFYFKPMRISEQKEAKANPLL